MQKWLQGTVTALILTLVVGAGASAAGLPKATQEALDTLKLDASILKGLDAELKVPQAWLDGAAKEEGVIILGTWRDNEFQGMQETFEKRYPSVKVRYHRTSTRARGMKMVIALREGRLIADVTTSIADVYGHFKKMKVLSDLRELPNFKNLASNHAAPDGTWASFKLSVRCMSYNTNLVKKADLPKTWDDLLTNPRWRGGNLALSNHASAWLLALWAHKGEKWGQDYTRRLFEVVQPQQRKEGMSASTALTVAGEFHANIPGPERRAKTYADKGAPVGYHCPIPVTMTLSQIVMFKEAKHKNSARIFINWLLSREGQILQYVSSNSIPSHKGLQLRQFIPFADTIIGKETIVRNDELIGGDLHKAMTKTWNSHWTKPVGKGRKSKGKRKGKRKKKQ
ncbi:MAG: iron(III) transport system substrate-binding protein [Alphaproteobacteria bacterium]|jgi:iron(III) transport system substrate-binding protein